jgi:hypothetical protein
MLWLADAEVPGDGLSVSMIHGHMSSGSPSTRLLCLHDHSHSLQTRQASHLNISSGARVPRTHVLIFVPLDSMQKGPAVEVGRGDICTVSSH